MITIFGRLWIAAFLEVERDVRHNISVQFPVQ